MLKKVIETEKREETQVFLVTRREKERKNRDKIEKKVIIVS